MCSGCQYQFRVATWRHIAVWWAAERNVPRADAVFSVASVAVGARGSSRGTGKRSARKHVVNMGG